MLYLIIYSCATVDCLRIFVLNQNQLLYVKLYLFVSYFSTENAMCLHLIACLFSISVVCLVCIVLRSKMYMGELCANSHIPLCI